MSVENMDHVIVNPFKGKNSPDLGPVAVLVSSELDLKLLINEMGIDKKDCLPRAMSSVYHGESVPFGVSVSGPFIGAPYATILMEELIAWGAKKILFFGWAGAISDDVNIGDIIVAEGAFADEGTSRHYRDDSEEGGDNRAASSDSLTREIKNAFTENDVPFHAGDIWTTDAIYRETVGKVTHFQEKKALAVEMELSALFTVAKFRNVEMGAILSVSDDLSTFSWQPGFGRKEFKKSRKAAAGVISSLCKSLVAENE